MSKPLTGRHVLFWLFGVFGIVFAVNGFFIARAVTTYPGEDVANPYLQGVDYNRTLHAHADQAAQGWKATIDGRRLGKAHVAIRVAIENHVALPADFELSGLLRHPMDAELDRKLTFHKTGAGLWEAELSHVAAGGWDVTVAANPASHVPFEASRRIWLP